MRVIQRVLYISLVLFLSCNKSADKKKIISGYSFGTSFSVQFQKNNNENVVKNNIEEGIHITLDYNKGDEGLHIKSGKEIKEK